MLEEAVLIGVGICDGPLATVGFFKAYQGASPCADAFDTIPEEGVEIPKLFA